MEDTRYGIVKRITKGGKVRYYKYDSHWRLRLMSRAQAELDLSMNNAVLVKHFTDK